MRKPAAPFLALPTDVCADAARVRLPRPKRGFQMRTGKFTSGGQDAGQIFENDDWNHPYEYWPATPIRVEPRRRLPLHVRVEERRRSPRPLRGHDQRRDVLHGRLLLPRRRVGPAPAGAELPAAEERASLLGDDRALSRPPGRDRLRSPRLAAARAPSPISLSGA